MSDKPKDAAKPEGDAKPAVGHDAAPPGGGGIKAWLPLIVTIVLMPVLAFATTKFLILPKVVQARGAHSAVEEHGEEAPADSGGHGATKEEKSPAAKPEEHGKKPEEHGKKEGKDAGKGKKKQSFPIAKVIVNVSGSQGSRYLMASFTLVGTHNEFKTLVEENKDQLLDLANTAMASKTITELEKPGARNQLRAELISVFNNALGNGVVQEIFFTEFAVQ